jgi:hypothetical protein
MGFEDSMLARLCYAVFVVAFAANDGCIVCVNATIGARCKCAPSEVVRGAVELESNVV